MSAERDTPFSDFVSEVAHQLDMHKEAQRGLQAVFLCACDSVSDSDAARLLLEVHGSEKAVKEWCEYHLNLINNVLRRWYATARIEAHEVRQLKGNSQ